MTDQGQEPAEPVRASVSMPASCYFRRTRTRFFGIEPAACVSPTTGTYPTTRDASAPVGFGPDRKSLLPCRPADVDWPEGRMNVNVATGPEKLTYVRTVA
jgi:hypothetical protein